MAIDYRCFFCFNRAFETLLKNNTLPDSQALEFTNDMLQLFLDKNNEFSTPQFARELHHRLKCYTKNNDPYKDGKKESNDLILSQYDHFKQLVETSKDPFETAMRLAIAGNIIDFAISDSFNLEDTIDKVLNSDFAINHSKELKAALDQAETVLYLGDNNGEIVFDKLFIETINHSNLIYAVRDLPVINDATIKDAEYVGLNQLVQVISNGYDAPSTILEHCSEEFLSVYNKADIIISKGQGNLEGLLESKNDKIFFLLMVKCDVIAEKLKAKNGDFVACQVHKL
ncbi:damage-control phosphatase ARMT1 family protein [Sunxiuqinia sp. A32]|uniref:damage-control phosphatase ARMT1 family protein n=1 Tax=Sunxiuqinia sp. A32 TaxID=3461496 RepID=UPI004045BEF1